MMITETSDLPIQYRAAMYRALGRQTRLSRSGYSITFTQDVLGRRDLSENPGRAVAQLRAAGIDPDAVTADDVSAYRLWWEPLYNARRIDQARFLVTRKFAMQRGDELVPTNRISLIDGRGDIVASVNLMCAQEYDRNARNLMGGRGAMRHSPDYSVIHACIADMRTRHPEFARAPVVDNNDH